MLAFMSLPMMLAAGLAHGQRLQVEQRPFMGWTTWSMQSKFSHYPLAGATGEAAGDGFQNEWNIKANSDAMRTSGLQAHGFSFINIDGDWDNGLLCQCGGPTTFDAYGRPMANATRFPSGMPSIAAYIHRNGQRAGIYWEGGVPPEVWAANTPILGTRYHVRDITAAIVPPNATPPTGWVNGYYNIDFSKPGAQEYIDSIVKLFAEWGFDYLKVDGLGSATASGAPVYLGDVRAISLAIGKVGRPMYFDLSASLDHNYAYWWQRYSNARRIDGDIECSTRDSACSAGSATGLANITDWSQVAMRFTDLLPWQNDTGRSLGWNDFDSLEVGNGTNTAYPKSSGEFLLASDISPALPRFPLAGQPAFVDGLTNDERQATVTLWSIGGSPLQLGDDLTLLDKFGIQILTNDEVLAVDQSGRRGHVVYEGTTPVYAQLLCDGSYYVALFNNTASFASVSVKWVDLGFTGEAEVRDLWTHQDSGRVAGGHTENLNTHAAALLRVRPVGERHFEEISGCERR